MAGSREMEGDEAWIPALNMPDWLRPGAINYNLIEGYCRDPAVTEQRMAVVIEEGGPSLSFGFQPGSSFGWNNIGLGEGLRRALLNRVHLRLTFARYK